LKEKETWIPLTLEQIKPKCFSFRRRIVRTGYISINFGNGTRR
jgi:hypothetical protein